MVSRVRDRFKELERRAELSGVQRAGAYSRRLVRKRRQEVLREHWRHFAVLIAIGTALVAGARLLLPDWFYPYVVGALVVVTLWVCVTSLQWMDGMASHRRGIVGEELTTDELRKLRRSGWRLINHVGLEYGDVDHALIGPGGFFAIDSKFRTDWGRDQGELDSIAAAARRQAKQLQSRLLVKTPVVQPVVVLWGPRSSKVFEEPFEHNSVLFSPGRMLTATLRSRVEVLGPEDVDSAYATLDAYVAKRDVGEAREHGDRARPLGDHIQDVALAAFFAAVTFLAVSYAISLRPIALWGIVVALVATVACLIARRERPTSERVHRVTAAVVATSIGWGVLMPIAIVTINFAT